MNTNKNLFSYYINHLILKYKIVLGSEIKKVGSFMVLTVNILIQTVYYK